MVRAPSYLSLRLVERVQVLAEGGDDALVSVGVLPEDVLLRSGGSRRESGQRENGRAHGSGRMGENVRACQKQGVGGVGGGVGVRRTLNLQRLKERWKTICQKAETGGGSS